MDAWVGEKGGSGSFGWSTWQSCAVRFLQIAYVVVSLVHEGEMGERLKKRALEAALWKKY